MMKYILLVLPLILTSSLCGQDFYLGADLSYANEMEDCGVNYQENNVDKDPYEIFADHGTNLVRLRLWHTPSWYDTLNAGNRYSDLVDVKRSIARAKAQDMQVLLDFHLSDFWADPSRQIVPAAWSGVVDDLPILSDSLYNYVRATLLELHAENLLPELIQVGNETNKGIMQSEEADAAGWTLDWPRNATLFNRAIAAIRDVETETESSFKVALHIAGPENAAWLMAGFAEHGVTDYDLIGLSYYWAWHQPTTIERTREIISELKTDYPGKEVMIFETGYLWTMAANDNASNIMNLVQTGYDPATPDNQKRWLIDLTQAVKDHGGSGVIYWEPAWVSSSCYTPWGQGSHQENAAFFDFESNLLSNGGIGFLSHNYGTVNVSQAHQVSPIRISMRPDTRALLVEWQEAEHLNEPKISLRDVTGKVIFEYVFPSISGGASNVELPQLPKGIYVAEIRDGIEVLKVQQVVVGG